MSSPTRVRLPLGLAASTAVGLLATVAIIASSEMFSGSERDATGGAMLAAVIALVLTIACVLVARGTHVRVDRERDILWLPAPRRELELSSLARIDLLADAAGDLSLRLSGGGQTSFLETSRASLADTITIAADIATLVRRPLYLEGTLVALADPDATRRRRVLFAPRGGPFRAPAALARPAAAIDTPARTRGAITITVEGDVCTIDLGEPLSGIKAVPRLTRAFVTIALIVAAALVSATTASVLPFLIGVALALPWFPMRPAGIQSRARLQLDADELRYDDLDRGVRLRVPRQEVTQVLLVADAEALRRDPEARARGVQPVRALVAGRVVFGAGHDEGAVRWAAARLEAHLAHLSRSAPP